MNLLERWLGDADTIAILDEASVSLVRERVRGMGGLVDATATASLVNVASELAHNQLAHARDGRIAVRAITRSGAAGLEVIAADRGAGIADPAKALRGHARASGSLGVGLAAVCELADEVDFDVRIGEGTCVTARKFAADVRRRQVGVLGRAIEGERTSGDDATFFRTSDALVVALADGLGHGSEAREAAAAAIGAAHERPFEESIDQANAATKGTRGAVVGVARIDAASAIDLRLVGNVSAYACARRDTRRHVGASSVLGGQARLREARESDGIALGEVLVLFSDGVSSKLMLENEDTLLHAHPIVIAQALLERFGTSRDDATVLVVK